MVRPLQVSDRSTLTATLREELGHSARARYLNRLHCLLLVARGHTCYEVASVFDESPRALERWVHRYESDGIAGLKERRSCPGRGSRRLTQPQLRNLQQDLRNQPTELGYPRHRWSGRLLQRHLERTCSVRFSVRHCQRLLKQLRE